MGKWMWYIFILILVYIVVVYYKGTSSVLGTFGSNIVSLVTNLQGRNAQGQITNYPQ